MIYEHAIVFFKKAYKYSFHFLALLNLISRQERNNHKHCYSSYLPQKTYMQKILSYRGLPYLVLENAKLHFKVRKIQQIK